MSKYSISLTETRLRIMLAALVAHVESELGVDSSTVKDMKDVIQASHDYESKLFNELMDLCSKIGV
jgi:hypothetical protein